MAKRAKGEGCIYKKRKGTWEGRIVVGHKEDGKPLFRFATARTQKEVLRKLQRLREDYRNVELRPDCQMSLSTWLDRWIETYMKGTIKEGTINGYCSLIENYIKPYLGTKPLYLINSRDVQSMYYKLKYEGRINEHPEYGYELSDTMVHQIHCVLHRAMDTAVTARLIAYNPTRGVTVPKANYKPMKVLNEEQLDAFIAAIEQEPHWFDFFYTAITTGMRLGEITALQWDDFDTWKGTIRICKTLKFRTGEDFYTESPKTQASRRTIFLPPSTADVLRQRKETAITKWIFYNPLCPEKPIHHSAALRKLKAILASADLPDLRFHDLRHTFATHAIASGVDAKTLAEILGHTNASFTLDTYAHVTVGMQRQAAKQVEQFLSKILSEEVLQWVGEEKETVASDSGKTDVGKAV